MKTMQDVLDVCKARGITLYRADNDKIGFRAKEGAVTDALLNVMRFWKPGILKWIDANTPPAPAPSPQAKPPIPSPRIKPAVIPQEWADTLAEVIACGDTGWVQSRTGRWFEIHPTALACAASVEAGRPVSYLRDFIGALNEDGCIYSTCPPEQLHAMGII